MLVSIITVTYNSEAYIKQCIESVFNQTYSNIEHIIIDGKSQDKTLEIIKSTSNRVNIMISELDNGIYHAMNKGLHLSKGEIIGILNSDDIYATNSIISTVVDSFRSSNCDSLFGNLDFVSPKNPQKTIRQWKSSPFKAGNFMKGWHPPHPTFFVRNEIYKKYGLFDTSLNISADFELMLRFLEKYKISNYFLDKTLVKMRYGGESTGSIKRIIIGNSNIIKAFKKNNLPVSWFYPLFRILPKLKQFLCK